MIDYSLRAGIITGEYDIEVFGRDNEYRIPETVNALANSSGGEIICEGFNPERLIPSEIPHTSETSNSTTTLIIPPLVWHKRPLTLNGRVYRRVEGQNLISGLRAKSLMAGDSHEFSRDDFPVKDTAVNEKCISEFYERVTELNGEMKRFQRDEFLRRCGVFSGKYLTFAGALMFGGALRVSAVLDYPDGHVEIERHNIWRAYTDILPRLTAPLSSECSQALTEVFVNALLHSDYNVDTHINILITSNPPKLFTDNPGTVRGITRNHRLKKILTLSGITSNKHGLNIIRSYMPSFALTEDMLNLRTNSTLLLKGKEVLPEPIIL